MIPAGHVLAFAALVTVLAAWPRRLALIGGTGGLVMIGLGVSIAAAGRQD